MAAVPVGCGAGDCVTFCFRLRATAGTQAQAGSAGLGLPADSGVSSYQPSFKLPVAQRTVKPERHSAEFTASQRQFLSVDLRQA